MPAVASVGDISADDESKNVIRGRVGGAFRLPAEQLFFNIGYSGPYATSLEMLRLAPSASNKQPWRVLRNDGDEWHLYLCRTKGYGKGSLLFRMLRLADLQRVDMGIAMCHFEPFDREAGLKGQWIRNALAIMPKHVDNAQYVITWKSVG
jgi:hypothetical protein